MTNRTSECAPADNGFSLISNQKLLALYYAMVRCRRIAENAGNRPEKRQAATRTNSILGHEAAAVGAAIDLLLHDTVAAAHWPDAALKAINPTVSVASRIPLAARSVRAAQQELRITLLFSNSNRASQASWLKALTLAMARNLPMLFVSLHGREGSASGTGVEAIPLRKKGYAFPSITVDGSDVVAVYRVASEAITHARKGHGPTLIECHYFPSGDPIQSMKNYLIRKGLNPEELA